MGSSLLERRVICSLKGLVPFHFKMFLWIPMVWSEFIINKISKIYYDPLGIWSIGKINIKHCKLTCRFWLEIGPGTWEGMSSLTGHWTADVEGFAPSPRELHEDSILHRSPQRDGFKLVNVSLYKYASRSSNLLAHRQNWNKNWFWNCSLIWWDSNLCFLAYDMIYMIVIYVFLRMNFGFNSQSKRWLFWSVVVVIFLTFCNAATQIGGRYLNYATPTLFTHSLWYVAR